MRADKKRTVLVTGANRGIGYEVCRQLVQLGDDVILTARDAELGRTVADSLGAKFLHYQVGKSLPQGELTQSLANIGVSQIDVVINNAAITLDAYQKSLLELKMDSVHKIFETNSFGPLILIREILPKIPAGGHIINVSSQAGSYDSSFKSKSGAYGLSKTLLNLITCQLAYALESKSIRVNAVCPGWVRTDMGGPNATRSVEQGAETIVWLAQDGTSATGKFFNDKQTIPW